MNLEDFPTELEVEALVRRIASRIHRCSPPQTAARYQLLVKAGMQAARKAIYFYMPGRDVRYPVYLKHRIHFAMFDAMRLDIEPRPAEQCWARIAV